MNTTTGTEMAHAALPLGAEPSSAAVCPLSMALERILMWPHDGPPPLAFADWLRLRVVSRSLHRYFRAAARAFIGYARERVTAACGAFPINWATYTVCGRFLTALVGGRACDVPPFIMLPLGCVWDEGTAACEYIGRIEWRLHFYFRFRISPIGPPPALRYADVLELAARPPLCTFDCIDPKWMLHAGRLTYVGPPDAALYLFCPAI